MSLCCFKLHRYYSHSFISSNIGDFFRSWFQNELMYLSSQNCFPVFMSSIKHEIRMFYISHTVTAKKCTKKCDRWVFASLKRDPIAFLPISLSLLSLLLKLPIACNLLPHTHIMKALPITACLSFLCPSFPSIFSSQLLFFFFWGVRHWVGWW